MSDLLGLLRQSMGKKELSAISQKIGADENATKKAISVALPALIGGLGRQTATPEGTTVLTDMMEQEDHGGILDNLLGMLGGSQPLPEPKAEFLPKILGGRQERVEQSVSKSAGIDLASAKKLIALLAPIVLGVLHKKKQAQKLDDQSLAGFLQQEQVAVEEHSGGLVGKLLDQDGDDDFDAGDLAKVAMGKLFG